MFNIYQKLRLKNLFENQININIPIELGFEAQDIETIDRGLDLYYLKSKLSDIEVGIIHSPFDNLNIVTENSRIREYSLKIIASAIEIKKIIDAKKIIFHTGIKNSTLITEKEYKNLLESIRIIISIAEKNSIIPLLENTYEKTDFFEKIIKDTEISFCLDIGHINCFSKESIDKCLSIMAKRIEHVHLHDNDGSGDQHAQLGSGNIQFDKILNFVINNNIDITLETDFNDYEINKNFIGKFIKNK